MLIYNNTLFNQNMENHPGKQYNHNTIMALVLAN
jgi:hypothetical protein